MYAFGLTVVKLGLKLTITQMATTNFRADEHAGEPIIHYAYGDERWSKRDYYTKEEAAGVWDADQEAMPGSILGELLSQIRQAREFYRDPYSISNPKST